MPRFAAIDDNDAGLLPASWLRAAKGDANATEFLPHNLTLFLPSDSALKDAIGAQVHPPASSNALTRTAPLVGAFECMCFPLKMLI
jgi:hypothetical protein